MMGRKHGQLGFSETYNVQGGGKQLHVAKKGDICIKDSFPLPKVFCC